VARKIAALLLTVVACVAATRAEDVAERSGALPSAECLQLQREARIALMRSNEEEALGKLEQAVERCERKLGPLAELLRLLGGLPGREEALDRARARLFESFAEIEEAGHPAVLSEIRRVLSAESVDERTLQQVERTLNRFVEAREDPGSEVLDLLLSVQLRHGDTEGARKTVSRRLPTADPNGDLDVWLVALDLEIEAERWQAALDTIEKLPPGIRNAAWMRGLRVRVLGALGRHDEMLEQAEPLLAGLGKHGIGVPGGGLSKQQARQALAGLKQAAWRLYDDGEEAASERMFRWLAERVPQDKEVQAVLAHLFVDEAERKARADELAEKWERTRDPDALLQEGSARLSAGDPEAAYPLLVRATALAPEADIAWYNRGLAALSLEHWEDAEEAFTEVLALRPDMVDAAYGRGQARVQLEEFEAALADLQQVVEAAPGRTAPWYYVYKCHSALGNAAEAKQALERYQGGGQ
jgi:tetratricopeptide (TPR) repeat protein